MNIFGNIEDSNLLLEKKIFMENNLTDFKKIKGFLCHEEGLFLHKLAKINCSKSFSVEIGSYCGKSACYIAEACKENKTYLISIDHHQGSEEQQFGEEYFDKEIYDYKKNIKPAPNPYYTLSKYQGNLTIDEYRSLFNSERFISFLGSGFILSMFFLPRIFVFTLNIWNFIYCMMHP